MIKMSSQYFIDKLEYICEEAKRKSMKADATDILVHTAKHLDRDSYLFTQDGMHVFSLSHTIPKSGMHHIFHTAKDGPCHDFLHAIDACSLSPYHYAATYDLNDVFDFVTDSRIDVAKGHVNHKTVKSLCLHTHPETKHSVPSLLIEKDKMATLATCMTEALDVNPFESEFEDTYSSWLHECILSDARSTANYLMRCHKRNMARSLQRPILDSYPREPMSPMDILLTAPHKNQMFYLDIILGDFPGGYRLISTSLDIIIARTSAVSKMTSESMFSFVTKCLVDTISFK
jgi:hypothetical protein